MAGCSGRAELEEAERRLIRVEDWLRQGRVDEKVESVPEVEAARIAIQIGKFEETAPDRMAKANNELTARLKIIRGKKIGISKQAITRLTQFRKEVEWADRIRQVLERMPKEWDQRRKWLGKVEEVLKQHPYEKSLGASSNIT